MSTHWRSMTLEQVYPYWVLGEVPGADIPYIAANDIVAGNAADEIVAVAALSPYDLWELDRLLPLAFARVGLRPITETEAAKIVALDRMREVARRLTTGEEGPLRGAQRIFRYASDAGLFGEDGDVDETVAAYGTAFLQLADALEARQGFAPQERQFEDLILDAAQALLDGRPAPEWFSDSKGLAHRGTPSWAST